MASTTKRTRLRASITTPRLQAGAARKRRSRLRIFWSIVRKSQTRGRPANPAGHSFHRNPLRLRERILIFGTLKSYA
ncbi:hypothetical protein RHECNPAF_1740045 [Rhizobium etli CNPAF512]|nr:hypothetical protein RHECNPAF_1740045 [Rhizobium etli CNPAF512]